MYSLIILLSIIFIYSFHFIRKINNDFYVKSNYVYTLGFIALILAIIFCLSLYLDIVDIHSKYFPGLFTSDALRYIDETHMFTNNILEVDEFTGAYLGYERTPKFGFPSLIASLDWLKIKNPYFSYYLMLFVIFLISAYSVSIYYQIQSIFKLNSTIFSIFLLVLFFFPTDYYWAMRYLREPIVNGILIAACFALLGNALISSRHFSYYILFSLELLFFRPQLYLLIFLFYWILCIGFKKYNILQMAISSLIFILAIKQMIIASGNGALIALLELIGLPILGGYLSIFLDFDFSSFSFLSLLTISFYYLFWPKKVKSIYRFAFKPVMILAFSIFLIVIMIGLGIPIRFIYPIFIFIKLLIYFYYLLLAIHQKPKVSNRRLR